MSSSSVSKVEAVRTAVWRAVEPVADPIRRALEPVWEPLRSGLRYVLGSFFRFLILIGLILVGIGVVFADGVVAGHLGIYGWTAVFIGVLGRLIIRWKVNKY